MMDDFLRNFISKKWNVKGLTFTFLDILLAVCITGTGLALRSTVIAYTPTDIRKIGAIVLELALAVLCGAIVHSDTGSRLRSFLTYAVLVIYPTVIANGSLWNINCIYYVILFFLGLYLYGRGNQILGGVSILAGLVIAIYRMRSWWMALNVAYPVSLSRGWPNFYEIIGKKAFVEFYDKVALLILMGMLLTGVYWFAEKKIKVTKDLALTVFLFLAILIPYFAPYMPAWAGYTADVAALLYFMKRPERFYVPMLHLIVSYSAYAYAINGETKLPMVVFSILLLFMLVIVGLDVYHGGKQDGEETVRSEHRGGSSGRLPEETE